MNLLTRTRGELRIELDGFDGPLDLLLHLIRKHEIDILDIPIAFITEEYLNYLDAMQSLNLDVAGEYLVMAATLLHIKSRMLLPKRDTLDDEADAYEEDPRQALVKRLLEYQRYRHAADELNDRELEGRDVFRRPSRADRYAREAGDAELLPLDLFALLEAFRTLIESRPVEAVHEVTAESLSIRETIGTVADYLQTKPRASLLDLIYAQDDAPSRLRIVVTFLALLEMAKLKMVRLFQARLTSSDLIVERAVIDTSELEQELTGLDGTLE